MTAPTSENLTPPAPDTVPFALSLFGPMQGFVQGRPLPQLRSRKALWLLALLALRHGKPIEREWLAATLWPDADPEQSFSSLRSALHDLRAALGSEAIRLFSPSRRILSLELTGVNVDVLAFDEAVASKSLPALARAVSLYRGSLLEGCTEEWVGQERTLREQDCLRALLVLAEAAQSDKDWTAAADYARRAVTLDPWRDGARRSLMVSLSGAGDVNAALQVYRDFISLLRDDPKAAPDGETSSLYVHLRAQARQAGHKRTAVEGSANAEPSVSGYLPHPLTGLIGREDEREDVAALLHQSRLVTLTGPGGIGKTRLAVEVAREVAGEYPGGVWLVSLEVLSNGSSVVPQIAAVLGIKESQSAPTMENVVSHLREKRLLLVLDNCEHLLETTAQAAGHLLQECAGVHVLATSREPLTITGETVWPVPELSVPDLAHLPADGPTLVRVLAGYKGVQLFLERAHAVQKSFALNAETAPAVAQICAQLGGIPLALELAAARVRAMTVVQMVARLDDHLGLLTNGSRTAPSRQRTLRAMLDWSYALLSIPEQLLLARVSVFAGGWSLEAAEAICGEEGIEPGHVLDLLTGLVDKSLVIFEAQQPNVRGRYRLLEMVRQYAAERLGNSGSVQIRARHQDWFLALAEKANPHQRGGEQAVWLTYFEAEHDNLRRALDACEEDAPGAASQKCLRLAAALWPFWAARSYFSEGRTYLQRALIRTEAHEATSARGKALKGAAVLADRQGDYIAAWALYEQSLMIFQQLDDKWETGSALGSLTYLAQHLGDVSAALEFGAKAQAHYEQNLIVFEELDDKPAVTLTHHFLGHLAFNRGDFALAATHHERSLHAFREAGDRNGVALALGNLGGIAYLQGDYAAARALDTESLRIYRDLGDKDGVAFSLVNLGEIAYHHGDRASAMTHYQQSLRMYQEVGNKKGMATAYHYLVPAVRNQGEYAAARALQTEQILLCQELGDKVGLAEGLGGMAAILLAQGEMLPAVRLWGATRSLRESSGLFFLPAVEKQSEEKQSEEKQYVLQVAQAKSALSAQAFQTAWEAGQNFTWEQAVASALAGVSVNEEGT